MRLFDLCKIFAADPALWPSCTQPHRALELDLRMKLRRSFGSILAASDFARIKSSDRLGISLRPYEFGDALRAVSVSHLIKTGELMTRTDFAPGRQRCGILFHGYQNMAFRGSDSAGNKGQVALALAGVVATLHEGLAHSCDFVFTDEVTIGKTLVSLRRKIAAWDYVYVISDALFDSTSLQASADSFLEGLLDAKARHAGVLVVRDPLELPTFNKLTEQSATLKPFLEEDFPEDEILYSGRDYGRHLQEQLSFLTNSLHESGFVCAIMSGRTPLEDAVRTVMDMVTRVSHSRR